MLTPLRKPGMFLTMAGLRYDGSPELSSHWQATCRSSGYCAALDRIEERSISQVAIAMFDDQRFSSTRIPFASGDVFALITDGLTEVFDAHDQELGLDAIKEVVRAGARGPLPALSEAMVKTARAHGRQMDDQTLLLIRVLA